jgi:hypothetical protein
MDEFPSPQPQLFTLPPSIGNDEFPMGEDQFGTASGKFNLKAYNI